MLRPIRRQGFIPWERLDSQLSAMRSIWIATTRPDGRPHAIPVWYVWDGRSLYFATQERSQKGKNLARQPWIVVHAGDGDDVLILEGPAEVVTDEEELHRVHAAYMDKYVEPRTGEKATFIDAGATLYRVSPRHAMAWMYGDLRGRTDWWFDGSAEEASEPR